MFASSTEEISRAVAIASAADVQTATPAQFVQAFTSVLLRLKEGKSLQYTTAAIKLRPDLAPQITVAALRAYQPDGKEIVSSCSWVDAIIRNAIAAAPEAKAAIVRAAVEFQPAARDCILAAAGIDNGTEFAFFRAPRIDAGDAASGGIGTINPANLSGQGNTVSENQERETVCHRGTTLVLPHSAAEAHLHNHPGDYLGACRP